MAHAFKRISAKSTFGTLQEELYQSDYINIKKEQCNKTKEQYNTIIVPINKTNLIVGQYTKLNLYNACTVSNGPPPSTPCEFNNDCNPCQDDNLVIINPSATSSSYSDAFYLNYTIDPLGELFGKNSCGILNYTNYMILNPPLKK
jgi:hypothetical protein